MKVKLTLSIGLANGIQEDEHEIDDDEVAGLDGEKLEEFLHQYWIEWAWQYIDGGPTVIK